MEPRNPSPWYRFRKWTASHFYPVILFGRTKLIGFGEIVKVECDMEEVKAMEFVRKNTTIPIPKIVKLYKHGEEVDVVMKIAKGRSLDMQWQALTPEQKEAVVKEICGYIEQMRSLVPPAEGIGSATMSPGLDHRLGGRRWGPFKDITEFHTYLRRGLPVDGVWSNVPEVVKVHQRPSSHYAIKFCHADFSPENIMVDEEGKVTAIIDWEFGGWYPEYWEYTKIYYGWRPYRADFYPLLDRFTKTYPEELEAEHEIWKRVTTFTYDMPTKDEVPDEEAVET